MHRSQGALSKLRCSHPSAPASLARAGRDAGRGCTGDPASSAAGAWQAKSPPGLGEAGGDVRCLGRESAAGSARWRSGGTAKPAKGGEGDAGKMMQLVQWIRQPRLEVAKWKSHGFESLEGLFSRVV